MPSVFPKPPKRSAQIFLVCAVVLVAAVLMSDFLTSEPMPPTSQTEEQTLPLEMPADSNRATSSEDEALGLPGSASSDVQRKLFGLLMDIREGASPAEIANALRDAKKTVHVAPSDLAAAAIIAMLNTGEDATTGLGFVVGPEGVMDESPTWRIALLDLLGQTDPFQFVPYIRTIIASITSPDEYALALRNLGWANSGGRLDDEIRRYFSAMLSRSDWRQSPSTGYLEAFDLAVATGTVTEVAAALDPASGNTESAVSRAAFVALDRLMLRNPDRLLAQFDMNPDFLSSSPYHRASILSRLDVRRPEQSDLLARYLLRPDHAPGELEYFFEVFPNGNRFTSHRLVTNNEGGGSIGDMKSLDQATINTLRQWLEAAQFTGRHADLARVIARLEDLAGEPPRP